MGARVRGYVVLAYTALSVLFFFLLQLPVMALTGSGAFSIWLARRAWAPCALWLGGVRVAVEGPATLPPGPAIFVSNHESALDIWVLFVAIRRNLRFVAKSELFRIPVFGWYLRLARFVPVDRHRHAQAVAALQAAARVVREGISLIVFPEGTRSPDARIQPFKKGPFVLAMEAGVPVVPVAIAGAAARNPKGRIEVHPGTIRVRVGEPLDPAAFADKTALLREVRHRIIDAHRAMGGLGGDPDLSVAARGAEGGRGAVR